MILAFAMTIYIKYIHTYMYQYMFSYIYLFTQRTILHQALCLALGRTCSDFRFY